MVLLNLMGPKIQIIRMILKNCEGEVKVYFESSMVKTKTILVFFTFLGSMCIDNPIPSFL